MKKMDMNKEVLADTICELEIGQNTYQVDLSEAYEVIVEKHWCDDKFAGLDPLAQGRADNYDHRMNTRKWLIAQGIPPDEVTHGICRYFYDQVNEWYETTFKKKLFFERTKEPASRTGTDSMPKDGPTQHESDLSRISIVSTPNEYLSPEGSAT